MSCVVSIDVVHVFPVDWKVVSTILVFYFYNIVIVVPPKSWGPLAVEADNKGGTRRRDDSL